VSRTPKIIFSFCFRETVGNGKEITTFNLSKRRLCCSLVTVAALFYMVMRTERLDYPTSVGLDSGFLKARGIQGRMFLWSNFTQICDIR
jgi:hypothetical protein